MSVTFRPGDMVRRTHDLIFSRNDSDNLYSDKIYTIRSVGQEGGSVTLEEANEPDFTYNASEFELVEPAPTRRRLPDSAQARSVGFAIGYLTALSYHDVIDGTPYQSRPNGLDEQDLEVLNSVIAHLERLRTIEKAVAQ